MFFSIRFSGEICSRIRWALAFTVLVTIFAILRIIYVKNMFLFSIQNTLRMFVKKTLWW